jgi:hypothetical protein
MFNPKSEFKCPSKKKKKWCPRFEGRFHLRFGPSWGINSVPCPPLLSRCLYSSNIYFAPKSEPKVRQFKGGLLRQIYKQLTEIDVQGMKEKLLGTFHKTSLLLEYTFGLLGHHQKYNDGLISHPQEYNDGLISHPQEYNDGLISRKCTRVINLFCETYLVVFISFLGFKMFHLAPSPSSLREIDVISWDIVHIT